jgi:hypothetical protein
MKSKRTIKQPGQQTKNVIIPQFANGITHADRKRWWNNYDALLVNRISEIKKATS